MAIQKHSFIDDCVTVINFIWRLIYWHYSSIVFYGCCIKFEVWSQQLEVEI